MTENRGLTATGALVATAMVATVSAVNQALPSLSSSSLHPSATGLLWIVDAYVVIFASLLLPAGALADRLGARRALLAGLGIYVVATALCALAPSAGVLLGARALAGIGAALALPTSLSVQLAVAAPERRQKVVAVWTAATAAGGLVGNVVGGALIATGGWRGLFGGLLPLGVASLVCAAVFAPTVPARARRQDPVGSALFVLSFVGLLAGLVEGPARGWGSAVPLAGFGVFAAAGTAFVTTSLRRPEPMLDPRLFRVPAVRGAALGIAAAFVAMFGLFLCYGQYLQGVKGHSAAVAGLLVLPATVFLIPASTYAPRLAARLGERPVAVAGLLVLALGVLGISTWGVHTSYLEFAAGLAVVGIGAGVCGPPLSHALVSSLPAERAGVGAALNGTAREVGSALGVAVVGSVTSSSFVAHLPALLRAGSPTFGRTLATAPVALQDQVRAAFAHGSGVGLRVAAVILVAALPLVARWLRPAPAPAVPPVAPARQAVHSG